MIFPVIYLTFFGYFLDWRYFKNFNFRDFFAGEFQGNFNDYFKDRLPVYGKLSFLKTDLDVLTGQTISNGVLIRDSQLTKINKPMDDDKTYLFSKHVISFSKRYDKQLYYLFIPSKSQLNYNFLQLYGETDKKSENLYDELKRYLPVCFKPLDYGILFENSKEINAYYRTIDQLNSYGAYFIYSSCIKNLDKKPYDMEHFKIYHVVRNYYGELCSKNFYRNVRPDNIDIFRYCDNNISFSVEEMDLNGDISKRNTIYDLSRANDFRKTDVIFGSDAILKNVETNVEDKEKILIFADRFIDSLMQFFSLHYKKITVVNLHNIFYSRKNDVFRKFDDIKINDYDRILFIYGIESLNDDEQFRNLKYFRN